MTKLDERAADAARELRYELASVPIPQPTRLVRRARRTRIITAAAAALVVGMGSLAFARAIDSNSATRVAAPLVEGRSASSTILTSWGGFGYGTQPGEPLVAGGVFVYADGRVLWSAADSGGTERRLSPYGLRLVKTGKLTAHALVSGSRYTTTDMQEKTWAEPTARPYQPSKYALCYGWSTGDTSTGAPAIVDQLPPAAQALLNGKQRTFDSRIGTATWGFRAGQPEIPSPTPTECFELTPAEHSTFRQILDANAVTSFVHRPGAEPFWPFEINGRVGYLHAGPIYPHGQPVVIGA